MSEIFSLNELFLSKKRIAYGKRSVGSDLICTCPKCGGRIVIAGHQPWHWHTVRCPVAQMEFGDVIRELEVNHVA